MLIPFLRSMLIVIIFLSVIRPASLYAAGNEIITLVLPAEAIEKSVQSLLPLPVDPQSKHLQGSLELASIEKLVMRDNGARVKGLVRGSNIELNTRIGDQDLKLKVGEVALPLSCDFAFRFDAARKMIYVTPTLEPPAPTDNPQADAVVPFLVLLNNREYPISLASVQTFNARLGSQNILVGMEMVDISITAQQVVVKMKPKLSKTN